MPNASLLDIAGFVRDGFDRGKARADKSALGQLMSQGYQQGGDRSALLGQIAQVSPDAAVGAQKAFGANDDERMQRVGQMAGILASAPSSARPQLYASFVPELHRLGLGEGLPPNWDESLLPGVQSIHQQLGGKNAGPTSEVQTFNTFAKDLSPEDAAKARRIQLGLEPRAVGAAAKSLTVDIDGVPTTLTFDPVTRGYMPAVVGGGAGPTPAPATSGPSAGGDVFAGLAQAVPGLTVTSAQRSPEHNREVGGVPNSYHLTGQARDILPPTPQQASAVRQWAAQNGMEVIPEGDHWHIEPRPGSPIIGRTKEAEAAAVEEAKGRVNLGLLPEQGRIEATNAGLKSAAEVAGKSGAEAQFNLPKVEQSANLMLTAIRDLKADPALKSIVGLNGKFNPAVYIPGTPEQRTLTRIKQINGQAFLQAYQTLRGGGQITEVEGQKATEAMGRLDRAQSYEDYLGALNDLETVITNGLNTARQQARGSASGAGVLKWNPATGKIE